MLSAWLQAALEGVRFGLQFNPLAVLVGSVLAAALVGYPSAPRSRWFWAFVLLLGAWVIGDGVGILSSLPSGPVSPMRWWGTAVMALVSLGVGYVLPAAAGAYVGRHVKHGTGWLSAMAVAGMLAGAFIVIAPAVAEAITARAGV